MCQRRNENTETRSKQLKQAKRRGWWDSNPGLSDPSTRSLNGSMPVAGVTAPHWAGNLGGRKAFSAEPPNLLHVGDRSPAGRTPPPSQAGACLALTPQAPGPARTLRTATGPAVSQDRPRLQTRSSHAGVTHHEGPAPPVLAEAVAPPGAQGHGGHLLERRIAVLEGILPPQVSWRHLRQDTRKGLYWGFAISKKNRSHHGSPFCT